MTHPGKQEFLFLSLALREKAMSRRRSDKLCFLGSSNILQLQVPSMPSCYTMECCGLSPNRANNINQEFTVGQALGMVE
jgi:hypothetical protein